MKQLISTSAALLLLLGLAACDGGNGEGQPTNQPSPGGMQQQPPGQGMEQPPGPGMDQPPPGQGGGGMGQ